MDEQKCFARIEIFTKNLDVLRLEWATYDDRKTTYDTESQFFLDSFVHVGEEFAECSDIYPCITFNYLCKRQIGFYVLQVNGTKKLEK